jgi:RHS repeat-associated protein
MNKYKIFKLLFLAYAFHLPASGQQAPPLSEQQAGPSPEHGVFQEAWEKWARGPISSPVLLQVAAKADSGLNVSIAGQIFTVHGSGCDNDYVTNLFFPNLRPYTRYPIEISGGGWAEARLSFKAYAPRQVLPSLGYRKFARPFQIIVDGEPWAEEQEFTATYECGTHSTNLTMEVRPNKGQRPYNHSGFEEFWSCDEDEDTESAPGDGQFLEMGPGRSPLTNHIAFRWSANVGKLWNGLTSGHVRLIEEEITSNIYNGLAFTFTMRSTNISELEGITNSIGGLRQIRAPQTVIDSQSVSNASTEECDLRFYIPENIGTTKDGNGLYPILTNTPIVTWRFVNPDTPGSRYRLLVIEQRPAGRSYTNMLAFDGTNRWCLTYGDGADARIETRDVVIENGSREEVVQISSLEGVIYKACEDYNLYPWGWELTNVVTNPGSPVPLTNTFSYYTNASELHSYSQLRERVYPSGKWEITAHPYYDYENGITKAEEWPLAESIDTIYFFPDYQEVRIRPWKDNSLNPEDCSITNVVLAEFTESNGVDIHGVRQSLETRYYSLDTVFHKPATLSSSAVADGDFNQPPDLSDVRNEYRYRISDDYSPPVTSDFGFTCRYGLPGSWLCDLVRSEMLPDYTTALYEYERGTFTNQVWLPNTNGADILKIRTTGEYLIDSDNPRYPEATYFAHLYHGSVDVGAYCVEGKSIQETSILRRGSPILEEDYFMSDIDDANPNGPTPIFTKYQTHLKSYDSMGHLTNIVLIDAVNPTTQRTVYQSSWRDLAGNDSELKSWEINEIGQRLEYHYDSRKRLTNVTLKGIQALGALPAIQDIETNFFYNAGSWPIGTSIKGGGLSLCSSNSYDLAGRLVAIIDEQQRLTTISFSTNLLSTTETLPGNLTKITDFYLDGRLKAIRGTSVIPEFHDYLINDDDTTFWSDGTWAERVYFGTNNSSRWKEHRIDSLSHVVADLRPAIGGTNIVTTRYWTDTYGFVTEVDHPVSADTIQYEFVKYDLFGFREPYSWFSGDGYAADRAGGIDQVKAYDGTNAWQLTMDWHLSPNGYRTNILKERLTGFTNANILSEATYTDTRGNIEYRTSIVDRAACTVTITTNTATSTTDIVAIVRNGLLHSLNSESVATPATFYYDGLFRQCTTKSPLGFTSGRLYSQTTPLLLAETNFAGHLTQYEYYPASDSRAGQIKTITFPNGTQSHYDYDSRGQQVKIWGEGSYPQELIYDPLYEDLIELHTFRNELGFNGDNWPFVGTNFDATVWTYDPATGLLLTKTDASGRGYTNGYDIANALISRSSARGLIITNGYDCFGDIVEKTYSDSGSTVTMTGYNSLGQPTQVSDAFGATVITYDDDGNFTGLEYLGDSPFYGYSLVNGIDPIYGKDSVGIVDQGVATVLRYDFGFDSNTGRFLSVSNGNTEITYGYSTNADLVNSTMFKVGGTPILKTARTWDYGYRLRSIQNTEASSCISGNVYVYDEADHRVQSHLADESKWKYDYNSRNELISGKRYWDDSTAIAGQQYKYSYDAIGNRFSTASGGDSWGANLRLAQYRVNGLNQYTTNDNPAFVQIIGVANAPAAVAVNGSPAEEKGEYFHAELNAGNSGGPNVLSVEAIASFNGSAATNAGRLLVPPATQVFAYDADGNLTNDAVWVYTWDAENRLISMSNTLAVATADRKRLDFGYDWQNRRREKKVYGWDSSIGNWVIQSDTLFLYDGWDLVAELDNSNPQQGKPLIRSYTWGPDLSGTMDGAGGIDSLLIVTDASTGTNYNHFAAYDGNGNVTALVKEDGTVTAQYEYSPFGQEIRSTGAMAKANPFRWSTKFWDEETGLSYYGYRYYSPALGRWLGRDPLGETDESNLFLFVHNNPISATDLIGLLTSGDTLAAAGEGASLDGAVSAPVATIGQDIKTFIKGLEHVQEFVDGIEAANDLMGGDISDWIDTINKLKTSATASPLSHAHHMGPIAVQGEIGAYTSGKLSKNSFLVKLEQKLHLKGLHGKAGGKYNELFRRGAKKFKSQMNNPFFVMGFAAGAMKNLGLEDAIFVQ